MFCLWCGTVYRDKWMLFKFYSVSCQWYDTVSLNSDERNVNMPLIIIHHLCDEYFARTTLQWRHNGCNGVSNPQPHDYLLNHLFGCRSKKTSKLRVTGLCVGNSPGTGEFPTQMASNTENVSIWWRHHGTQTTAKNDLEKFCLKFNGVPHWWNLDPYLWSDYCLWEIYIYRWYYPRQGHYIPCLFDPFA